MIGTSRRSRYLAFRFAMLALLIAAPALLAPAPLRAQEPPYMVTYSHALEEPGNLEVAMEFPYAGEVRERQPSGSQPARSGRAPDHR